MSAKRRRVDEETLSHEEREKLTERRARNKEAAEKSRKKKKEEFEKLQGENDQLNQDKCELAAKIETLKKQNVTSRIQLDQLKRWIAKRADMLGLQRKENISPRDSPRKSDVLRGDPSPLAPQQLHELADPWQVEHPQVSSTTAQVCVPDQTEKKKAEEKKTVTTVTSSRQPVPAAKIMVDPIQTQPVQMISEEQPMSNPVNTLFFMHGEGGQPMLMQAPLMPRNQFIYGSTRVAGFSQTAMPANSQVFLVAEAPKADEVEVISSANSIDQNTKSVIGGGNVADGKTGVASDKAKDMTMTRAKAAAETATCEEKSIIARKDPSVIIAVESLLEIGNKTELRGYKKNAAASAATSLLETGEESMPMMADHSYL